MLDLPTPTFLPLLQDIHRSLTRNHRSVATAESCTGGLISALLTELPGSSQVFKGGICTYANTAKEKILNVDSRMLALEGAVSEVTARSMAIHATSLFQVDYAVSVTGIAGPDGATPGKPVGTVWIGLHGPQGTHTQRHLLAGLSRQDFRIKVSELALLGLLEYIKA